MKKLILILCLAITGVKAQERYCDSTIFEVQKKHSILKMNLYKSKEFHNAGTALHVAGFWFQVVLYTGLKEEYFDKNDYRKYALATLGINALAYGFHLYSRVYVQRAELLITPNSLKIKF